MSIITLAAKYKDVLTIGFSVLSFIIACTSLFFSGRTAWHDRSILKITGRVVYEPVYEKAYKIEVEVLNVGRRDAVLEGVLRHYEEGHTSYEVEENGITLREKNRVKFKISLHDFILSGEEGEVYALEDLTILDIENKEYEIPNSQELIKRFRENN